MPDFPNSPALNDLFTSGWSTWMWDGVKWMASVPSGGVYEPVFGGTQYPMYGFLYNKTIGDPGYSTWAGFGAHTWRFGTNPGDDFSAGMIDYRSVVSDALSIVGAGTTAGSRKINLYDNVNVAGNLTVGTTTILGSGGGIFSVGQITATGPLAISGPVGTTGSSAILTFQDRSGTTNWGWYAQAGVARLWNDQSGDRITIDGGGSISTPGSLRTGASIFMGGPTLYFYGVNAGGPYVSADTINMTTQLGTGNGSWFWYNNPGAVAMQLNSAGNLFVTGALTVTKATVNGGLVVMGNPGGPVTSGLGVKSSGGGEVNLIAGSAVNTGYIEWRLPSTTLGGGARLGYMGWNSGTTLGIQLETATQLYIAGVLNVSGYVTTPNLYLTGNYVFFAGYTNNGPSISGDATNIVARMGPNNGGLYVQNNQATVNYHSFTVDGNAYHNSVLTVDGSVLKRGGGASYRMCPNVNNAGYGSFWYTDASNMYLLLTAVNDAWGSFNSLRPFYINLASGVVSMEQGLVVYNGSIRLNNGSTGNTFITYNGGNYVQMFDDGNGHIESNSQIWINGNTGNGATVGGPLHITGPLYPSNVYMPNNVYIWFLDTGGSARYGLILANDNQYYLSDGSLNLIVRAPNIYLNGYTHVQPGTSDNARITVPNNCHARWFYEVAGTRLWSAGCINTGVWYLADESVGQVRFQIDTNGNATIQQSLTCGGNIQANGSTGVNGIWWGNSGGWWWTGSPIHTDSAVQAGLWITAATDISAGGQLSCSGNLNVSGTSYLNGNQTRVHGTNANDSLTVTSSDYSKFLTVKPETQGNWCQIGYYCGSGIGWGTLEFVGQCYYDNNINCGDFYSRGNVNSAGLLYVNGLMIQNYTGWWWTANPIHTDSDLQCNGSLYFGGNRLYNNSGYAYFDQTVHAAGVYSRGDIWNAGNINAGNQVNGAYIHSTGDARCDGSYTCGGWYYGGGNGGAQIRCWAGDWGAMSFAMSGGYFEVSPDQGVSGYYFANAGNWSDARLKLNIRDSEIDALGVIRSIPIRAYEWTEEGRGLMPRNGSSVACGIVAQELEELIPSAVDIVPVSGGLAGGGMRRIIGDQFDAYYIRAIQQLLARIEELENLVLNPPERNLA